MNETRVADLLNELTPSYDDRGGDWERVAAAAGRGRRRRAGVSIALAVMGAVAVALAWPFHAQHGGFFDRALAAVGDGPVLHVVLRGDWGGTLLDLRTGERSPVYGDDEYWYDTQARRVHLIERLGGAVLNEELSRPQQAPVELQALGRDYRHALETGRARVDGEGTIDGEPVAWITIHRELLPDVADGKDHEFAQQVAVSRRTFEPLALRATRDGKQGPGTFQRVLGLRFLSQGEADFTVSTGHSLNGAAGGTGREVITLDQARTTLGRPPLWLGREYEGLPLAGIYRETTSIVRSQEVRITGPAAAAAERCAKLRAQAGVDCILALGRGRHPIEVRPDGVFTTKGQISSTDEQTDVLLFYGSVGDDPTTFQKDSVPLLGQPHVTVHDSTRAAWFRRIVGGYVPPPGTVFFAADGTGYLHVDGIHVSIEADGERAILAVARALEPAPR